MAPGVSWSASLPTPLGVPDVGLPCDTVRPMDGMSNPPPVSRLLFHLLPQFFIADFVWPMDLDYSSEQGVDENLDSLHGSGGDFSPGHSSIEQDRLHNGVDDPGLGVHTDLRGSADVLQLEENFSRFADSCSHICICICPPCQIICFQGKGCCSLPLASLQV